MKYYYPFGEELKPVVQQDKTLKRGVCAGWLRLCSTRLLALVYPRQIGALGAYSEKRYVVHKNWENKK